MTKELEPCAYCGLPLKLVNRPWLSGADGFEVDHINPLDAAEKKCPMVMACYDTEEEAIEAVNTRYKRTCKREIVDGTSIRYGVCSECKSIMDASDAFCRRCGAEVADV